MLHLDTKDEDSNDGVEEGVKIAIRTAPPTSGSHTRALTAKALLSPSDRNDSIAAAFSLVPKQVSSVAAPRIPGSSSAWPMNLISGGPVPADLKLALTFAKCLDLVSTADIHSAGFTASAAMVNAQTCIQPSLTLLSFVAALNVLDVFTDKPELLAQTKHGIEELTCAMRVWIGGSEGHRVGISGETRGALVEKCLGVGVELVGMKEVDEEDSDAGYVSQEEGWKA